MNLKNKIKVWHIKPLKTRNFEMKNTDKVTLTVGQLKRLIKESFEFEQREDELTDSERDALHSFIDIITDNSEETQSLKDTLSDEEMKQLEQIYAILDDDYVYPVVKIKVFKDDIPLLVKILDWADKYFTGSDAYYLPSIEKITGGKSYRNIKESASSNKTSPYIDIPKFRKEIEDVLNDATDSLDEDAGTYVQYMKDAADDYMDEYVDSIVDNTIKSFDKYVHQNDTSMVGNFADIKFDYEYEHKGKKFRDIIEMIDSGEKNSDTEEFKEWTIGWYFDAFGTYNLKYKWLGFLEEVAYDEDEED